MSFTGLTLMKVTFQGLTGIGSISVPGVRAGDVIVRITDLGNSAIPSYFEGIVSVDDEIQQLNSNDFSSITFTGVLVR